MADVKVDAKKRNFKVLTQEQVDFFLEKGYVVLRGAVPKESIQKFKHDVWVRLGMDPNDKSTWHTEELHMPRHRQEHASTFAPKVWGAMGDLLGGEDRLDWKHGMWGNGFICNMGNPKYDPNGVNDPKSFDNWHVDGDWFRHFLDSECQALETLVLFSDVEEKGGPTYICTDGIKPVCEWFLQHPEGADNLVDASGRRLPAVFIQECHDFVQLTGKEGDVFLCHPFTPHSRSTNFARNERFIINPHVTLKEPFNYNRENPDDYSLVELKTLKDLGLNRLDFKPASERARFRPRIKARNDKLLPLELERLDEYERKTGIKNDSMHKNGEVYWQAAMMDLPPATA